MIDSSIGRVLTTIAGRGDGFLSNLLLPAVVLKVR